MIPEENKAAVARGLREAFGDAEIEDIRVVPRGPGSTLVFRMVVRGHPCLLRIVTRINEMNDPARQFAYMRIAAEAGLAPRVRYTSIDDAIGISDFVETVPLPAHEALVRVPAALRALHALPPFPKTFNYGTADRSIRRFQTANILAKEQIDEVFAHYAELSAVYPRLASDMVSCHNDLKPENILFDGHRVWLTSWKAAFTNDRYFDLAVFANYVVGGDAEEETYVREYFGRPADGYQKARFFLMRQVIHMFGAAIFLLLGESQPRLRTEGMVHWEQLLRNMRQERFGEALSIVSARHAGDENARRLLPDIL